MQGIFKYIILYLILVVGIPVFAGEEVLKTFTPPAQTTVEVRNIKPAPAPATPKSNETKVINNVNSNNSVKNVGSGNIVKPSTAGVKTNSNAATPNGCNTTPNNNGTAKAPAKSTPVNGNTNGNTASKTTETEAPQIIPIPETALTPPVEFTYKEGSAKIHYIDPSVASGANKYYPGLRGSNQLIVYTPAFGLRTGTNEFGTEAVVIGNIVVQLNGADSIIPRNGFVISGHGNAKKWINENIQIGTKIYIDIPNKTLKTYLTPDSLIFAAKQKITEANSLMEYYRQQDILYDDKKAMTYINKSKDLMRKAEKDPDNTQIYVSEAMDAANLAIKNAIPYKADELKGVWIRPTEKTPDEIIKTINYIKSVGINNVFLETYFHGKTIYPSEVLNNYGLTNQREEFVGFDPLRVWVDECRKRDIKINIWFETFYIGNQNPSSSSKHILSQYPDWANTTKTAYDSTTPVASLSEHNGYFIDPANPEVREYLLKIISEIITKYCPDGINLDYIRYPQCIDPKYPGYDMTNWGYTTFARNEFFSLYQVDPIEIKYNTTNWYLWAGYRQNKITNFVREVKKLTQSNNIVLTAVIFPDRQKSLDTKMQDWKTWSLNNLVDGLTPLILTSDKNTASILMKDIKINTLPTTKVYAGLFVTFMGGPFDDLLMQIQESRKLNTNGVIIFDYAHLEQKYVDALQTRVFDSASINTAKQEQTQAQYGTQPSSNSLKSKYVKIKKRKR